MKNRLTLLLAAILSFSAVKAQTRTDTAKFCAGVNILNLSFLTPNMFPDFDGNADFNIYYKQAVTPNLSVGINFQWHLPKVSFDLGINEIYNSGCNFFAAMPPYNNTGSGDTVKSKGSLSGLFVYAGINRRYGKGKIKVVPGINWEFFYSDFNSSISYAYYSGPFNFSSYGVGLNPVLGIEYDWRRFSITPQTGLNMIWEATDFLIPSDWNTPLARTTFSSFHLDWDIISQISIDYSF